MNLMMSGDQPKGACISKEDKLIFTVGEQCEGQMAHSRRQTADCHSSFLPTTLTTFDHKVRHTNLSPQCNQHRLVCLSHSSRKRRVCCIQYKHSSRPSISLGRLTATACQTALPRLKLWNDGGVQNWFLKKHAIEALQTNGKK